MNSEVLGQRQKGGFILLIEQIIHEKLSPLQVEHFVKQTIKRYA